MSVLLPLTAGPIKLLFQEQDGAIRHLKLGRFEVLRGIYAAVRDENWGTLSPNIVFTKKDILPDSFSLEFTATVHKGNAPCFAWNGILTGDSSGAIRYSFRGEALAPFKKNRVGFCILHHPELAGKPVTVESIDGARSQAKFPLAISGRQPFFDVRALSHEAAPGIECEVRMSGDTFEMEDQRNWTDASYKTYCTPLSRPFPVALEKGMIVEQEVTLRLNTLPGKTLFFPSAQANEPVQISAGDFAGTLPATGLCFKADKAATLNPAQKAALKSLKPSHLRVDLKQSATDWVDTLIAAADLCSGIGSALELVIHLRGDSESSGVRQIEGVINAVRSLSNAVPVARWIILHEDEKSCQARWPKLAAPLIRKSGLRGVIGTGTDAYFTELNRERPSTEDVDFVSYSINPQVHAFDDLSLIETLTMQGLTVQNASSFSGKSVVVSPITLLPRFNPNATSKDAKDSLAADPRQQTAFNAVWTAGSIKHLAEADALAATYFELAGPTGIMGCAENTENPLLYPVFHTLAWMAKNSGAPCIRTLSSKPLEAEALLIRIPGGVEMLAFNYCAEARRLQIDLPLGTETAGAYVIDFDKHKEAPVNPALWASLNANSLNPRQGHIDLLLPAYGLCRIIFHR